MWHFLRGYVILQIEGMAIARFLRRISDNGIRISRLRQIAPGVIQLEIATNRFFDLHRLKRGLPIRIHIVGRCGFPFFLHRMRKRPALWIGTLLMLILLFLASQRIWVIRIVGNETIDPEMILMLLKEHGLQIGARPKGPVLITAANDLSARIHDAAWIGLDREGITLKVSVVEATAESDKRVGDIPSDLIADRDGIVTEITVIRGQALVKVGDMIKKGDVLISGTMLWKDTTFETWADGLVRCAVRYQAECEVVPTVMDATQTERTETVRTFRIGPWTVFQTTPSFERYRLTDERNIPVSDRLPTFCDTYLAHEIILRERTLEAEEAEQLALTSAAETARSEVPTDASILNQYGTIQTRNEKTYAVVIVTAEETIGRTEDYSNGG